MIPTIVPSSSPSTASSNNSSATTSNSSSSSNNQQQQQQSTPQNTASAMIGIASLILEGRAIADDEYYQPQAAVAPPPRIPADTASDSIFSSGGASGFASGSVSGSNYQGAAGRQSPKPSTSRAAYNSSVNANASGHIINITTNPHAFGGGGAVGSGVATTPLFIDHYNSGLPAAAAGFSSSSSAESMHMLWTQKLCALRQASPTASISAACKQKVSVEAQSANANEPELVALAINDSSTERSSGGGDFEIVRRVILQRHANMGGGVTASAAAGGATTTGIASPGSASAAVVGSGGGADNFLHSLQSLATTCLRGSSPSTSPLSPQVAATAAAVPQTAPQAAPKYHTYRATTPTPPPSARFQSPFTSMDIGGVGSSASSSGSGIQSPRASWSPAIGGSSAGTLSATPTSSASGSSNSRHHQKEKFLRHTSGRIPATVTSAAAAASSSNATAIPNASTKGAAAATAAAPSQPSPPTVPSASTRYPQQGPHCDQFLRKMGLAKGESVDAEDHFCDMSYVNITCSRWRAYCLKMEAIITRGVPVCIEVYLGPVGHKILLEQWIITQKEKVPPPTMTLPSLCSAIRSQLYFSQISAWCDLIKKSDKTIYDTGRIIFSTTMATAAGDLATTTNSACSSPNSSAASPPSGTSSNQASVTSASSSSVSPLNQLTNAMMINRRPRLNIFYRIKQFDSTACFNSKPNIHNFPNVNITENCSISVCLKSLPRINGGIPNCGVVGTAAPPAATITTGAMPTTPGGGGCSSETINTTNGSNISLATSAAVVGNGAGASSSLLTGVAAATSSSAAIEAPRSSRTLTAAPALAAAVPPLNCDNLNRKSRRTTSNYYAPSLAMPSAAALAPTLATDILTTTASTATTTAATAAAGNRSQHPKCTFFIDEEELEEAENAAKKETAIAAGEDEEEDDDNDDDETTSDLAQGAGDSSNSSFSSSNANLSHRERQLMKYRKRMQKRDKKRIGGGSGDGVKPPSTTSDASCELSTAELVAYHQPTTMARNQPRNSGGQPCCSGRGQPMEQGDDELEHVEDSSAATARRIEMISTGTQTPLNSCQHCGSVKTLICFNCNNDTGAGGAFKIDHDEMDNSSTSSSISSSDIIHTPRNKAELLLQAIQRTPKAAKKHKKQTLRAAAAATASQLQNNNHLSAISLAAATKGSAGAGCQVCKRQKTQHNFSNATSSAARLRRGNESTTTPPTSGVDDSADALASAAEFSVEEEAEQEGGGSTDETGGKGYHHDNSSSHQDDNGGDEVDDAYNRTLYYQAGATVVSVQDMDEESYMTSTKLTPHIDRCSLSATSSTANLRSGAAGDNYSARQQHFMRSCTPPAVTLVEQQRKFQCDDVTSINADAQFKTPTNVLPQHQQTTATFHRQHTPKPNLLLLTSTCNYHSDCATNGGGGDGHHAASNGSALNTATASLQPSLMYETTTPTTAAGAVTIGGHNPLLLLRKALPKVNLTPLFCSPHATITSGRLSAPIHSSRSSPDTTTAAGAAAAFSFEPHSLTIGDNSGAGAGCIPVQKSYSAPTLPNSPSLSPRFAKQAAIYKRRSRHLSDRSDRSSLGSDELLSDEDLDSSSGGMYGTGSPATSPLKQRARIAAAFGRLPLLGNLEESLLQRRLVPKIEVLGFKVLLGASGGFCPTQLTIPAASFFYELHGEALSTPYVCDIRLPRKGYSVPRAGTVQATLLNPMGTVVRMFVIPYDMRDMPPLHQTFIRQRILAEASTNETATLQSSNGVNIVGGVEGAANHHNGGSQINGTSNNNKYRLSPSGGLHGESNLGHFISAEHMKRLRYSIHLRFQTSRSGRLTLHTDIRLLISRRTDCDTAAAHAKGVLEAPNDLVTDTVMPTNPKYSARQEHPNRI